MFKRLNVLLRALASKSVNRRQLVVLCFALLLMALNARVTPAVNADVRIRVQSLSPPRLIIEGEQKAGRERWSFRKTYAGLMVLGERISGLVLTDSNGNSVGVRKLGPGEYDADAAAMRFRYEVNLDPTGRSSDSAYVSWLNSDRGLLMLGDLLPSLASGGNNTPSVIRLSFELPDSWLISSVEKRVSSQQFEVSDPDDAVFFAAKDLQELADRVGSMEFRFVSSGQWAFSARELLTQARSILESHASLMGGVPCQRALLILSPFPGTEGAGRWSAETRGSTVVLLSGQQPAKTAALVQLSMPLAHELFHLWVPNGLALEGNYDWFYEGFTIYQAMRTAQRLNILTFQDFLNAVGRAFDTYSSAPERDKLSLIEASQRRWTTSPSLIYQKAMLVALLYDLTLRRQTKGKRSLDDVYVELFRRYRAGRPGAQANEAVIRVLSSFPGMQDFARTYVETPSVIDLPSVLARCGLRVERVGLRTQIFMNESLNREQRDLLRRLGYNAEARGAKHK